MVEGFAGKEARFFSLEWKREGATDNENGESMESMEEVPLKGIDILRIFVFQKRVFFLNDMSKRR